jgi:methionyl-tRNA formyltransferase
MRIVILTSTLYGTASACLPRLAENPKIDIAMIVYSEGQILNRWKYRKRQLKKIVKIGLPGAFNGIRIRPWFSEEVNQQLSLERLDVLANRYGIRLEKTPTINCQRTIDLFTEADAQLGLSLGNGYIGRKVFSIPQFGMANIHSEILPQFQGAQSVIWQIHEGSLHTGYTIHQIDQHIDTGKILYQEKIPIEFKPTLRETVSYNGARITDAASKGLSYVVSNYSELAAQAQPQSGGRSFTTPTFWQYLKMVRQHKKLYRNNCSAE